MSLLASPLRWQRIKSPGLGSVAVVPMGTSSLAIWSQLNSPISNYLSGFGLKLGISEIPNLDAAILCNAQGLSCAPSALGSLRPTDDHVHWRFAVSTKYLMSVASVELFRTLRNVTPTRMIVLCDLHRILSWFVEHGIGTVIEPLPW